MASSPSAMAGADPPALTTMAAFTADQRRVLATLERVGGALSLCGVMLVFVTFYMFKRIRTVPNTFILFASIANVGASVASLIALDGIEQGDESALCQTQGFLFEMFMQSDPWWSFAMAINVWMVFFLSANPTSFRQYLWIYGLICFGVPAIPAFVCLFLRPNGKPIYGDAILWCWIDNDWNSLRIYSYYLPIWVCIALSALIYILVGYQVFHQRNQLRNLTLSNQAKDASTSDVRDSAEKNLTTHSSGGYYGTVTTEVQVTSNTRRTTQSAFTPPVSPSGTLSPAVNMTSPVAAGACYHPWSDYPSDEEQGMSSSSAAAIPMSPISGHCTTAPAFPVSKITTTHSNGTGRNPHGDSGAIKCREFGSGSGSSTSSTPAPPPPPPPPPSNFHSTSVVSSGGPQTQPNRPRRGALQRMHSSGQRFAAKLRHMDPVKLAYLRTSFVFAISVLVTWTPSSINRVYNLVYPDKISYGLNIASAAVLPLQGVWNAAIYFSTSHRLLREEFEALCFRSRWLRRLTAGTRLDGSGLAGRGRAGTAMFDDRDSVRPAGSRSRQGGVAGSGVGAATPSSPLGRALSRQQSAVGGDLPRQGTTPRIGTVRVQRGGELDSMTL